MGNLVRLMDTSTRPSLLPALLIKREMRIVVSRGSRL
jgi:hypothetical protein